MFVCNVFRYFSHDVLLLCVTKNLLVHSRFFYLVQFLLFQYVAGNLKMTRSTCYNIVTLSLFCVKQTNIGNMEKPNGTFLLRGTGSINMVLGQREQLVMDTGRPLELTEKLGLRVPLLDLGRLLFFTEGNPQRVTRPTGSCMSFESRSLRFEEKGERMT